MEKSNFATMKKALFAMVICMMAVLAMPGLKSSAASSKPSCVSKMTAYYYVENGTYGLETYSSYIYIKNLSSSAKISSVKSSNSKFKASSVVNTDYTKMNAIEISVKNPLKKITSGTTTKITFKVKQNGKTYTLSCKVTFKLAPSPVKTLKIGSKNYASSFKGTCSVNTSLSGKKKVTVTAASGYKIDSIYAFYSDGTQKKVKNGSKISTTNLLTLTVYYSVKTKPTNYKKPTLWNGKVSSPLQEYIQLTCF
ncbi:MAG: hypothetical protein LUI87_06665 [Lachnospiraceae bacterium]|nr:hypothetical protein [Lachnospiraceae bacterium]